MAMIYVKTKPGRRMFYEGKVIPEDKFVPVPDDPFIRRLIYHWKDLEVESGEHKADDDKKPSRSRGPTPRAAAEPTQPVRKDS